MSIKIYQTLEDAFEEVKVIANNNQRVLNKMGRRSQALINTWRRVTNYDNIQEEASANDLPGLGRGLPTEVVEGLAVHSGYGLELKCAIGIQTFGIGKYDFHHGVYTSPLLSNPWESFATLEQTVSAVKQTLQRVKANAQGAEVKTHLYTIESNEFFSGLDEQERKRFLELFNRK